MKLDLQNRTHRLAMAGLLTACVTLLTVVVAIPIPAMAGAYVNLGDAAVHLCAFLLGNPWGALAAAVGSGLADLLLGSALYAGPTFLIKGAMAFLGAFLLKRWQNKRVLCFVLAGLLVPAGYFLFESILYGAATASAGLPANLMQYAVGVALGSAFTAMAQRMKKA